jgi:hypothetical protein
MNYYCNCLQGKTKGKRRPTSADYDYKKFFQVQNEVCEYCGFYAKCGNSRLEVQKIDHSWSRSKRTRFKHHIDCLGHDTVEGVSFGTY